MARAKASKVAESTAAIETESVETVEEKVSKKGKSPEAYDPQVTSYKVKMWFIQPLLGSSPGDPDIYKKFIASKAPDAPTREEELQTNTVENVAAKGTNVYLRRSVTGSPCVSAHTVKGYFKETVTATKRQKGGIDITNHKTKITGNTVIEPPFINLNIPEELIKDCTEEKFKKEGFGHYAAVRFPREGRFQKWMLPTCDRPLQAETPQGKITSIASSEIAPAGTSIEYVLKVDQMKKDPIDISILRAILRGQEHGTGQWRGSEIYGRFVAEIRDMDNNIIMSNTEEIIGCNSEDPDFHDRLFEYIEGFNL